MGKSVRDPPADRREDEYVTISVTEAGFADPTGSQGLLILTAEDGRSFPMSAFSGEVADFIGRFQRGDRTSTPSVYKLISELADSQSLFLTMVEVYERGGVLRADLYFEGRNGELVLRNYRASDSIALATFYDVPIRMRRETFDRLASMI